MYQNKEELIANCSDLVSCICSLCKITGLEENFIIEKLKGLILPLIPTLVDGSPNIYAYFINEFRIRPEPLDKIYWFHFTRALDVKHFLTMGILPMNESLKILELDCYKILSEDSSLEENIDKSRWRAIWNDAINTLKEHDRVKLIHKDYGPYGMFVKEAGLYPVKTGTGNFFQCPEILRGIFESISTNNKINIFEKFVNHTKPYVITFETCANVKNNFRAINNLFQYAHCKLNRNIPINYDCHSGHNNKIGGNSIICIEEINFDERGCLSLKEIGL